MEIEFKLCVLILLNAAVLWLYGAPLIVAITSCSAVSAILLLAAVKGITSMRSKARP
ncbi:hypothetical protein GS905_11885 [Rhodococcus hoagii]|uniref:Uncharacterized protein n=1 Tax=Rhodococcus hoagii TaxID=43767 RepID=A0A9Q4ZK19_RHOHA|nr:hypothetical protein [Prescottella equi]MBM4489366.1 hypothetical protein [Prescottella equi]MBM4516208.1 hypothetical protein [Prescottella equi]MBM4518377.1 hypothetical protein [Prescottella equi]MBM4549452.1 hypothetical protein [Prescottella equi]MBM4567403.1 hypothetical protein [Prescottella equi]